MLDATVGSYRLVHQIGEGGMGTVWVGEHKVLGRRAAIKLLLPSLSSDGASVKRFFNEARALTAIADPGIVQIFDFGTENGSAYIVMELLQGETLDARIRRLRALAIADTVRLGAQIATSIGAAHNKGVIHRDLKPENVFVIGDAAVTGGERTKVLDFGIAKLSHRDPTHQTQTGTMIGTPAYMSPEQCRGAAAIDHRSDIYSLGCLMFCMVTGRPPFEGDGSGDVIVAHIRDQPPVPSSIQHAIPSALDRVILRCLEKDPARRYQTMEELAKALVETHRTLHSLPTAFMAAVVPPVTRTTNVTTQSTALGESTAPPSTRRRWTTLLAVIGFVIIGVGAGLIVATSTSGSRSSAAAPAPPSLASPPSPHVAAPIVTPIVVTPIEPALDAGVGLVSETPDAGPIANRPHSAGTLVPVRPQGGDKQPGGRRDGKGNVGRGSGSSRAPATGIDRGD